MKNLRRWQLEATDPISPQLAADARLSATDYQDDQVWELSPGISDSPALVLQTRYGGRVGLASLVPMWFHDGRVIYQAQGYATPPRITAFAPGYMRLEAALTPQLGLIAEYWVMESHAVGAQYTLANAHNQAVDVRLDLFGMVGANGKDQPLHVVKIGGGEVALHLGDVGNLNPAALLEGAGMVSVDGMPSDSKISRDITIPPRKKISVKWVHAGLPNLKDSVALAGRWLKEDWSAAFKKINSVALAVPIIETGDADTDAAIAFSYQQLVQSFLKPTASLPYPSFVATRRSQKGFSPRSDTPERGWSGQAPTLAYLTALGIASVNPAMAQGVIRNYLAVQQPDGWIDWKPGLGGQKQGILCLPILARLAWGIFQYTEDAAFLGDTFPGLLKFFERWLKQDVDGDGLPEWQSDNQSGYAFMPTFAAWQTWGQGADIRTVEAPDLLAYLLSEAQSLREIAYYLRDTAAETALQQHIDGLKTALEGLWRDDLGRYAYRDRDTHQTNAARQIITDAKGADELLPSEELSPPSRLIVRVTGGVSSPPKVTMQLDGLDAAGAQVSEATNSDGFVWANGRGSYTSGQVFSRIDRIKIDGLSRVYRVDVQTVDTTRLDISALLPLWSAGLTPERAEAVMNLLLDEGQFWRANGVTMNSAQDANFDPSNANGAGGVWPFWVTLMGEGLIEYGRLDAAADLLRRLLAAQTVILKGQKTFAEFYNSDEIMGLGETGHSGGVVPLHLLLRVLGVRVISGKKVWTGGPYPWGTPVVIRQQGVIVRRDTDKTQIEFLSGHTVELENQSWQEVIDKPKSTKTQRQMK